MTSNTETAINKNKYLTGNYFHGNGDTPRHGLKFRETNIKIQKYFCLFNPNECFEEVTKLATIAHTY